MEITDVRTVKLGAEMERPIQNARATMEVRASAFVLVETDVGLTGIGEGYGPNPAVVETVVEEILRPVLLGEDPLDIEHLWQRMVTDGGYFDQKGHVIAAISGVDLALWDLAGKYHDAPVYELLGGATRDDPSVRAYANDLYWDDPETMADRVAEYADRGFQGVKIHIGRSREADERRVRAITDRVEECALMVDANCGYDEAEAVQVGDMLESYDVHWYEEPVRPHAHDAYSALAAELRVPIAGGENEYTKWGFRQLLQPTPVDQLLPNVTRCGGLTEARKIVALAETFGVGVSPHSFSTGVNLAASLHLLGCSPACEWIEWDVTPYPLIDELLVSDVDVDADGYVAPPSDPGLGVELPDRVLDRYDLSSVSS